MRNEKEQYRSKLPLVKTEGLVMQDLGDELLVYDMETKQASCLNRSARSFLQSCDGETTVYEAAEKLDLSPDLVISTVGAFSKAGLLAEPLSGIPTTGISRRKLLRAAATLGVAVPIVSTLVAPSAVHAASCGGAESPCTQNPGGGSTCCAQLTCVSFGGGGSFCAGCIPVGSQTNCFANPSACCPGASCILVSPGVATCQNIIG